MPYWRWTTQAITWQGKDPTSEVQVAMNMVDHDFTTTFGIEIIQGRDFSKDFATDSISAYVINQSMAELMGTENPVGAELTVWDNPGVVVGVMNDFHFRPLDEFIRPLALLLRPDNMGTMSIRIQPGDIASTLAYIDDVWSEHCPEFPFTYSFLDEQFDRSYRQTERMGTLAAGFSLLAVFIAGLGLLGLASFAAEQRTKEVGIRKVLGASAASVIRLLNREFAVLVLIANVIVWPIAWLVSKNWLENFAYHIDPDWSIFVLTGSTTLLLSVVVVSTQTVRAALANPADSLKYE
jgi:ABC-type antimicrobial peptide transport system permease subunit